jgi:hypothetical protein
MGSLWACRMMAGINIGKKIGKAAADFEPNA